MLTIQRVDASMFPEVYPLLLELDGTYLTESDWRNIFNYKWDRDEEYCGYALVDEKKIVGFLGLIFSKRLINDRIENFCHVTSWIVKKEYRSKSLSLMLPVSQLRNHTIVDMTPSREAFLIGKRLGFIELDKRIKILFPINRFITRRKIHDLCFIHDKYQIERKYKDRDTNIFQDHMPYKCHYLFVSDGRSDCYIIYVKIESRKFPHCYIHHISNVHMFAKYSDRIRVEIATSGKASFVLVDSRLVHQVHLPLSCDLPFRTLKLYKSSRVRPEQIDNLYSELVLLNLNILPSAWNLRREFLTAYVSKRFDIYGL